MTVLGALLLASSFRFSSAHLLPGPLPFQNPPRSHLLQEQPDSAFMRLFTQVPRTNLATGDSKVTETDTVPAPWTGHKKYRLHQ